jgi:hypothetical protein
VLVKEIASDVRCSSGPASKAALKKQSALKERLKEIHLEALEERLKELGVQFNLFWPLAHSSIIHQPQPFVNNPPASASTFCHYFQ